MECKGLCDFFFLQISAQYGNFPEFKHYDYENSLSEDTYIFRKMLAISTTDTVPTDTSSKNICCAPTHRQTFRQQDNFFAGSR